MKTKEETKKVEGGKEIENKEETSKEEVKDLDAKKIERKYAVEGEEEGADKSGSGKKRARTTKA
jgi:hypothetical protein